MVVFASLLALVGIVALLLKLRLAYQAGPKKGATPPLLEGALVPAVAWGLAIHLYGVSIGKDTPFALAAVVGGGVAAGLVWLAFMLGRRSIGS